MWGGFSLRRSIALWAMIGAWGPHQTQSAAFSGDGGRPITHLAFYWLIAQRLSRYLHPQTNGS